ncbi:MAG TPA: hypothetical protein VMV47_17720 [Bacteroidales bacterium]|nr:hypothetical protein [Bacteroidales bacterium]
MKKLNFNEMSTIYAGDVKSVVADLGCVGVGLSFGLVNPLLGAIMGIGCGLAVYYKS